MKRNNWKIFINYGYKSEFDLLDDLTFKTKKDACAYAKEHGYPQKCVVSEDTWKKWKESKVITTLLKKDMKKYNVFDIDWDVDDDDELADTPNLPTEVVIEVEDEDDIADALSEEYGFCVNSFSIG